MCAIFGFVSRGISRPDLNTLARIIRYNACRGPHAFGLAWIDRRGRICAYKQEGSFVSNLGVLTLARDARLLIGHLRYATHGEPSANINNHPHPCDGGWIVHNGVVSNYAALVGEHDLCPVSDCDSEAIALLIERSRPEGVMARCVQSVKQTRGGLAIMGLWKPGTLVAVRRGQPLHLSDNPDGTYLATLPGGLPGKPRGLKDNSAVKITYEGGQRHARVQTFAPEPEDLFSRHG